jgi:hypothetical protein
MVDLVHTITIERPFGVDEDSDMAVDVDDYGQPIREYDTTFDVVQGLIQPKTAREQALTSQAGAEVGDHTIYMLRRDITTRDRLLDTTPGGTGAYYEIVGIRDYNYGALSHIAIDAKRVTSPDIALGS